LLGDSPSGIDKNDLFLSLAFPEEVAMLIFGISQVVELDLDSAHYHDTTDLFEFPPELYPDFKVLNSARSSITSI